MQALEYQGPLKCNKDYYLFKITDPANWPVFNITLPYCIIYRPLNSLVSLNQAWENTEKSLCWI